MMLDGTDGTDGTDDARWEGNDEDDLDSCIYDSGMMVSYSLRVLFTASELSIW